MSQMDNINIIVQPIVSEVTLEVVAGGIPGEKGDKGDIGLTGDQGLKGDDGTNGIDGDSAYEVWLSLGNVGTEQDYLDSLKGADGGGTALTTSVDATLFDGNLAPTDTDLQKVAQKVDDLVVGGGGGGSQIYDWKGHMTYFGLNWIKIAYTQNEIYSQSAFSLKADSGILIPDGHFNLCVPFGVAQGNQVVESLKIYIGRQAPEFLDGISILKVKYANNGTSFGDVMETKELLYENIGFTIPFDKQLFIPAVDFTNINILDGEILYMFLSNSGGGATGTINVNLKTNFI